MTDRVWFCPACGMQAEDLDSLGEGCPAQIEARYFPERLTQHTILTCRPAVRGTIRWVADGDGWTYEKAEAY